MDRGYAIRSWEEMLCAGRKYEAALTARILSLEAELLRTLRAGGDAPWDAYPHGRDFFLQH